MTGILGYISLHYALKGRISKVYLVDSAVELGWLWLWVNVLGRAYDGDESTE